MGAYLIGLPFCVKITCFLFGSLNNFTYLCPIQIITTMAKKIILPNPKEVKTYLTIEEALDLLAPHMDKKKKRIHTMTGYRPILMGCDVDLSIIKKRMKGCSVDGIRLSGQYMRGANHGVAVFFINEWMFLATDKSKVDAIHKLRKIK